MDDHRGVLRADSSAAAARKSLEAVKPEPKRRGHHAMHDHCEGEVEVCQLLELEDFGPSKAIECFRGVGAGTKK
jgi:hypothetical protein